MPALHAFLISVAVVIAAKTFAWIVQWRTGNAGLVDPIWSLTLGGLAGLYALLGSAPVETRLLLAAMGGLWGFRLGFYLWRRNWGKPEDWRYAQFRKKWGDRATFNMFWFFQFQNIFTLLLSGSAFIVVAYRPDAPAAWAVVLAIAIWLVAVGGESVADRQLKGFRADPSNKGKVCQVGLWRYSRHPNYFFECVHWLAYVPLAIGTADWWVTLIAPVVMAWMLMKLSGVPMLEEEMIKTRPGYAEYVRRTSALIPWFPKTT